jgi:hypothetical protein
VFILCLKLYYEMGQRRRWCSVLSLGLECVCLLGRKSRRCGMGKKRDLSLDEERSEVKMLDGFETLTLMEGWMDG